MADKAFRILDAYGNPMVSIGDNADANPPVAGGLARVFAELAAWDGGNFNRIRCGMAVDGLAPTGFLTIQPTHFNGTNQDRLRGANKFITLNAIAIGAEATLWTPGAGKKFRIMGGCLSVGTAAGNVVIKDNTAGTTILVLPKAPLDTPFNLPPIGNGILSAAANNLLTGTGVATATISGFLFGTEE